MSELLNGFYAFTYKIHALTFQYLSDPFDHAYLELLTPFIVIFSILSISRIITAQQLVLLSLLFAVSPPIAKFLLFGSITKFDITWIDTSGFLFLYASFTIGNLILLIYLGSWLFLREKLVTGKEKWFGHGALALAFLLILVSGSTLWAFLYLVADAFYRPEIKFQWYGQFLAILMSPMLIVLTVPAVFAALPQYGKFRILSILTGVFLICLLLYSLFWSASLYILQVRWLFL